MKRLSLLVNLLSLGLVLGLFLAPLAAEAATTAVGRSLVVSGPQDSNSYYVAGDLAVAAPVAGDLTAAGASVTVSEPVGGDATLLGGTIDVRQPVGGDLRAIAMRLLVGSSIKGDLVAAAAFIDATGTPDYAYLIGGSVTMRAGANGPVRIYAASATLAGTYASDVIVTASDRITLEPGTVIKGQLRYNAPQQLDVPTGVQVLGGVHYTGTSFLPTSQEAQTFALAGAGLFLIVRFLAVVIAAGLLAGLFPAFSDAVAEATLSDFSRFGLLTLLGFGLGVATPILLILLTITFAGIGIALVIGAAYILLALVAYLYAGVIAGAALVRRITGRRTVYWRDAVIGMFALSLVASIPYIGWIVLFILWAAATGAITSLAYSFAFPKADLPV